jgi:hypothetical protein
MKHDRIMVWKFDDAPIELQRLNGQSARPAWIACIPKQLHASDVDEAIRSQWGTAEILRYETSGGDVVYMGHSAVHRFLETVAAKPSKDPMFWWRPN